MSPLELQNYLYGHIPLTKAMAVEVIAVERHSVSLAAPLEPNINHRQTVFGGSASALAILSAWCLIQTRLTADGIDGRLVIQENTMSYDKPILGKFLAISRLNDPGDWDKFKAMLQRKGKARITVRANLEYQDESAGSFKGEFVALGNG